MCYGIGFAHSAIPHCHHDTALAKLEHNHHANVEHHNHEHDHDDHHHVEHNDHLDEGLLDFVICLLTEVEHPDSDIDQSHLLMTSRNARIIQGDLTANVALVLSEEASSSIKVAEASETCTHGCFQYSEAAYENISERGPPTNA
ncbi:MAG: hypothetical protein KC456_06885 [Flavobacteriales bacterium]|nr:hypothetical protein [Flavobacteriales bacterium]